jgi:hypothetical protein
LDRHTKDKLAFDAGREGKGMVGGVEIRVKGRYGWMFWMDGVDGWSGWMVWMDRQLVVLKTIPACRTAAR